MTQSPQLSQSLPPTQQPQSKGERGCLKGCLIAGLAALALTVILIAGGYFAGRAYLRRQMPVWQERYPVLTLLPDVVQWTGGLQLEDDASDEHADDGDGWQLSAQRREGVDDKTLLPSDIVLYDDPLAEAYSIENGEGIGYQRLGDAPAEVVEELKKRMVKNNWQLGNDDLTEDGTLLTWQKDDRTVQIQITTFDEATEIWLRYGPATEGH
ncbi:MAG: hypothetical protein R6V13_03690 [Anaerolineae bacterium]